MRLSDIMMDIVNKKESFLVIGLVLGLVVGLVSVTYLPASSDDAQTNVKEFYELIVPGSEVEITDVSEESGLFRVTASVDVDGEETIQESFVTRDGKLLSTLDSIVVLDESISQIEKTRNFIDCLYDSDARIYGVLDDNFNPQGAQATAFQLNLLSPTYAPKLFVSCDGNELGKCVSLGITEVPTTVVGNQGERGIKSVEWFTEQTGCKLG